MKDFAAIDFETANNERSSVCSVGIVIVRNGEIVDSFYSLIQPGPNYYNYWCSQVHGLCHEDTDDAPVFPKVWAQIEPLIENLPLVAHNKPFDEGCLKAVSVCISWTILTMSSMIHLLLHAELSAIWKTTNCIQLLLNVDIVWRIITMLWQMQKHVPGLQEKYCSFRKLYLLYGNTIQNIKRISISR